MNYLCRSTQWVVVSMHVSLDKLLTRYVLLSYRIAIAVYSLRDELAYCVPQTVMMMLIYPWSLDIACFVFLTGKCSTF